MDLRKYGRRRAAHGKEVQKDAFSEGKRLWEYYHKDR